VSPVPRDRIVEDRRPEHERVGLGASRFEEARDIGRGVLAIGVELDDVCHSALPSGPICGSQSGPPTPILAVVDHFEPRVSRLEAVEHRAGRLAATVIDDDAR
jgi:hypothetical protein